MKGLVRDKYITKKTTRTSGPLRIDGHLRLIINVYWCMWQKVEWYEPLWPDRIDGVSPFSIASFVIGALGKKRNDNKLLLSRITLSNPKKKKKMMKWTNKLISKSINFLYGRESKLHFQPKKKKNKQIEFCGKTFGAENFFSDFGL